MRRVAAAATRAGRRWGSTDNRVVAQDDAGTYLDDQLVSRADALARKMVRGEKIDADEKEELRREVARLSKADQLVISSVMDDAMLTAIDDAMKAAAPKHTYQFRISHPDELAMRKCLLELNKLRHEMAACHAAKIPWVLVQFGYQRLRLLYYYQRVLNTLTWHFVFAFMCIPMMYCIVTLYYKRHTSETYLTEGIREKLAYKGPQSTYQYWRGRELSRMELRIQKQDASMTELCEYTHLGGGTATMADDHLGGLDLVVNPEDDHMLIDYINRGELDPEIKDLIRTSSNVNVPFTEFLEKEGID
eukprot:TRINITY_DN22960_c0_g1_i1.p1 TRINITY_DN22960_c0_g1~~TRINITY_DN22960_c0_g1_i1.p1  ORF type:complete len:304 (+),score=73.31 TRINITY_DN22960_c0_g1_i1:82-993(+)